MGNSRVLRRTCKVSKGKIKFHSHVNINYHSPAGKIVITSTKLKRLVGKTVKVVIYEIKEIN